MMGLRLASCHKLLAHLNRERQVRQPAAVQVSNLAAAYAELDAAEPMRRNCNAGPTRNLCFDPLRNHG